jgi:streptogramin lyase
MQKLARNISWAVAAIISISGFFVVAKHLQPRQVQAAPAVQVDKSSIGGVVLNNAGQKPEAGVWVIAETKSLPVPYRKIVVTDDKGQFMVPDLPEGSYDIWVRGYGLHDSERTKAARGGRITLHVDNAKDAHEAARIYPANYWTSLVEPPPQSELPAKYTTQEYWLAAWRQGCNQCHQLGMVATRRYTDPAEWDSIFQRNSGMNGMAESLGKPILEKTLAEWDTRIQGGEVPQAPARPTGMERNMVVTEWDWGADISFIHDLTSTDKRNPTLYPYGKVYGADRTGGGRLWALDPVKNTVTMIQIQPRTKQGYDPQQDYYHDRSTPEHWMASPHNPMFDEHGHVWMTVQIQPDDQYPSWAKAALHTEDDTPKEIDAAYAMLTKARHSMQLGYYDTESGKFVMVDTIYNTHHLQFDAQDRIWANNPGDVVTLGELDTRKIDPDNPQGTEEAAQKAWIRIDPNTLKRITGTGYATAVSPVDGTVWQADPTAGGPDNKLYKFDPETGKFKDYPLTAPGRLPHGIDFSTDGNIWFSAESGHLGKFDPKTEKFTYWRLPGPSFKGTGSETGSTEAPYFLWVDQFNTSGMGANTVFVTGTTSDSMLVFDPQKETWTTLRMPYPMPFYTRGLDGRIDDAKAGWKGRGIWATYSSYMPKFTETRMGYVTHIQMRPNPLAN